MCLKFLTKKKEYNITILYSVFNDFYRFPIKKTYFIYFKHIAFVIDTHTKAKLYELELPTVNGDVSVMVAGTELVTTVGSSLIFFTLMTHFNRAIYYVDLDSKPNSRTPKQLRRWRAVDLHGIDSDQFVSKRVYLPQSNGTNVNK